MDNQVQYNWIVSEPAAWPPRTRPTAPFGVSAVEVARSCPLRLCFEASKSQGYEPRSGFAGHVGIAFHRTLQSLYDSPMPRGISPSEAASRARDRFRRAMAEREAIRQQRPREQRLPQDQERVHRAVEAIMLEARRLVESGLADTLCRGSAGVAAARDNDSSEGRRIEVEVSVASQDNLLAGRIDRVEYTPDTVCLVDYKSAFRDDLPERYERQLQLYAWLWHESRGLWPTEAYVAYPFTATTHPVEVEPEMCSRVAKESKQIIEQFEDVASTGGLGTPGEVCQVCEFRPWCNSFWDYQASSKSHREALERARHGFQGEVAELLESDHYWRLAIQWRSSSVTIVSPVERFPQLRFASPGMTVRALDMRLRGHMFQPRASVTDWSEIFIVLDRQGE
ncbi:MAG: PD-(D/E)XK nuclease family protein [bacterium]